MTTAHGLQSAAWLLVALPALSAAVLLMSGKVADKWGSYLGAGVPVVLFVYSIFLFFSVKGETNREINNDWFNWISVGNFHVEAGQLIDPLAMVFILLITGVGSLIHIYAVGYMGHDPGRRRFFGYFNLFVAAMLLLVTANSYLLLYVGWEGVGVASYLLIGYYYDRPSAATAAKKAFIANRVGDVGLSIAIMLMFAYFGSTSFDAGVRPLRRLAAMRPRAWPPRSASCCCSAPVASQVSSRCRRGFPTPWKARPRSRRSSTPRRWSPPAST